MQAKKLDLSAILWDALFDQAAEMTEAALAAETAADAGPETVEPDNLDEPQHQAQPRPPAKVKT